MWSFSLTADVYKNKETEVNKASSPSKWKYVHGNKTAMEFYKHKCLSLFLMLWCYCRLGHNKDHDWE